MFSLIVVLASEEFHNGVCEVNLGFWKVNNGCCSHIHFAEGNFSAFDRAGVGRNCFYRAILTVNDVDCGGCCTVQL